MAQGRIISFEQLVIEADPDYLLDSRQPEQYEFSNGRIFWHRLPVYDPWVNNIAEGHSFCAAVGSSVSRAVASSIGLSTAAAISPILTLTRSVGTATGTALVNAGVNIVVQGVGAATGKNTMFAYAQGARVGAGSASGSASVAAVGQSNVSAVGQATGTAQVNSVVRVQGGVLILDSLTQGYLDENILGKQGVLILDSPSQGVLDRNTLGGGNAVETFAGDGAATGVGSVHGVSRSVALAVGAATGTAIVLAQPNKSIARATGSASVLGVGGARATSVGTAVGRANNQGQTLKYIAPGSTDSVIDAAGNVFTLNAGGELVKNGVVITGPLG